MTHAAAAAVGTAAPPVLELRAARGLVREPVLGATRLSGAGVVPQDVDDALVRLLGDLGTPGPLPGWAADRLGPAASLRLARRLVLDGVAETASDGGWVSGPAALDRLYAEPLVPTAHPVVDASVAGLREHGGGSAAAVASRLYEHGTTDEEVGDALLAALRIPARGWSMREHRSAWLYYWRDDDGGHAGDGEPHKLYVSVPPALLPDCLRTCLRVAEECTVLKVGRTADDVRRPDKLVLYVNGGDVARRLGMRLADELSGAEAHGVPFSCPLDTAGLVSLGRDPDGDSWRWCLVKCMAAALATHHGSRAWEVALRRVELLDVAARDFAPGGGFTGRWWL